MATFLASTASRGASGLGAFPISVEADLKVSHVTVADITERDAIPSWKRMSKMEVKVIDASPDAVGTAVFELGVDLTTWTDVTLSAIPDNVLLDTDILDGDGYIQSALIQNLFINDSFVVTDEAAMLALTTVTGNAIIQTGDGSVWIKKNNADPSVIGDFSNITANTGAVTSVNGDTGAVSITMANLLAVAQNVTDFNEQVNLVPEIISNTAAIVSLQDALADINAAIDTLEGAAGKPIKTWNADDVFSLGDYVNFLDSNSNKILYEVIQTTTVGKSPEDVDGTDYFKVLGNYYTKAEIDTALASKADLVSGRVPVSQLPTSLLGVQVVDDIAARDALTKFEGLRVLVIDAIADPAITSGSAEYVQDSDHTSADSEGYVLLPAAETPAVANSYVDTAALIADRSVLPQQTGRLYMVGSSDPYTYYHYLGTSVGDITDYSLVGGGGSYTPPAPYATIAALLADQGAQENNVTYHVTDATTDTSVDAGSAGYRYKGTTVGDLTDYTKVYEGESLSENILTSSNFFSAVRGVLLTGLSLASSAVISATDSVLVMAGKLQAQITLRLIGNNNLSDVESKDTSVNNLLENNSIGSVTHSIYGDPRAVDFDGKRDITLTLDNNIGALSFTNLPECRVIPCVLRIEQNGVTGYSIASITGLENPDDVFPDFSTVAGQVSEWYIYKTTLGVRIVGYANVN